MRFWLPPWANRIIIAVYVGICCYAFYYFWYEFEDIAIYRQGSYTRHDFVVGLLVFLLVMELSRIVTTIPILETEWPNCAYLRDILARLCPVEVPGFSRQHDDTARWIGFDLIAIECLA